MTDNQQVVDFESIATNFKQYSIGRMLTLGQIRVVHGALTLAAENQKRLAEAEAKLAAIQTIVDNDPDADSAIVGVATILAQKRDAGNEVERDILGEAHHDRQE